MNENQNQLLNGDTFSLDDLMSNVLTNIPVEDLTIDPIPARKDELSIDDIDIVPKKDTLGLSETDGDNPPKETEDKPTEIVLDEATVEVVNYKTVVQELIASGIWESFDSVEIEGENKTLEELDLTEDLFKQIVAVKQAEAVEKAKAGTIPGENLSDFTKQLIEIEKNGGDVSKALALYQNVGAPIDSLDITTEAGQIAMCKMFFSAKNESEETVNDLIDLYKSKGILQEKAESHRQEIKNAYDRHLAKLNQDAILEEQNRKEKLKEYKNNLKENLSKFEISENLKKQLVDVATKNTADKGISYEIDKLYQSARQNPELAADLVLFLTNREEYNKQVAKKELTKKTADIYTTIKLTKKREGDSVNLSSNGKEKLISLEDL